MPMNGARVYAAGKLARNVREAAAKTVKLKPAQIYSSGSGLLELVFIIPSNRKNRTKACSTASSA